MWYVTFFPKSIDTFLIVCQIVCRPFDPLWDMVRNCHDRYIRWFIKGGLHRCSCCRCYLDDHPYSLSFKYCSMSFSHLFFESLFVKFLIDYDHLFCFSIIRLDSWGEQIFEHGKCLIFFDQYQRKKLKKRNSEEIYHSNELFFHFYFVWKHQFVFLIRPYYCSIRRFTSNALLSQYHWRRRLIICSKTWWTQFRNFKIRPNCRKNCPSQKNSETQKKIYSIRYIAAGEKREGLCEKY